MSTCIKGDNVKVQTGFYMLGLGKGEGRLGDLFL